MDNVKWEMGNGKWEKGGGEMKKTLNIVPSVLVQLSYIND